MKTIKSYLMLICFAFLICSCDTNLEPQISENLEISNLIDGVIFEAGNWQPDLSAGQKGKSLGNHRVVLKVGPGSKAVWAHIPWRRNDPNPAEKDIIVINAQTGEEATNSAVVNLNNELGDIVFQPNGATDLYYVYYMPYQTSGGYYPKVNYLLQESKAKSDWLASLGDLTGESLKQLSQARTLSIQSINEFHSFFPMEVIATAAEVKRLLEPTPKEFYLFPEYRDYPIRMRRYLPKHWVDRGLLQTFNGVAKRGEYYTFQIGVYAANQRLDNLALRFEDLQKADGTVIEKMAFNSFNTYGIDQFGRPFSKSLSVEQRDIQPFWIGIQIPRNASPGLYSGTVTVAPGQSHAQSLKINLQVIKEVAEDNGDDQPAKMSRLRWLNSKIGTDPDFIVAPYIPVNFENKTLKVLGRDVVLGTDGLPAQIRSYFTQELTLADRPEEILANPINLNIKTKAGKETWVSLPFSIEQIAKGQARWTTNSESENFNLRVDGVIEYEGMLNYKLILVAKKELETEDISLFVSMLPEAAKYILGLGFKGQKRPAAEVDWKWDVTKHHEGVWFGNINKGLQYVLRDENYERPLNTNFYQAKPLNMPPSWYNESKGGIRIETRPDVVLANNYSGPRRINRNDTLHFNIRFLVTPFKPIDTRSHFNTRFVHKYVPVDSVKKWGGTVVNIHHANEINPYINYPFYNLDQQTDYIQEAHRKRIKVKLYYTIRELTYKCYELFALRSFGDEIFNDGDGGGHSWLQEHLQDRYHSAWHAWRVDDAAILNKGTSRWTNYYVEGLNWLAKNQHIDGLYLDDIAFSRETVKRMVSVLNMHRDDVVIDLHSANQYNNRDGFINSVFLYMEHIPFVSRLWFGEYFEYDQGRDYWLTEVSGLPFGLLGEMLEKGGHPYRGMLYGMTTRLYDTFDPRPIWKLFDEFNIAESRMIGYWVEPNPIKTSYDAIPATSYVNPGKILIALASWENEDVDVRLQIDWNEIGFAGSRDVTIYAPNVEGLQEYKELSLDKAIRVPKQQGLFVVIDKK